MGKMIRHEWPDGTVWIDEEIDLTPERISDMKEIHRRNFDKITTDLNFTFVKAHYSQSQSLPEISDPETPLRDGTVKE